MSSQLSHIKIITFGVLCIYLFAMSNTIPLSSRNVKVDSLNFLVDSVTLICSGEHEEKTILPEKLVDVLSTIPQTKDVTLRFNLRQPAHVDQVQMKWKIPRGVEKVRIDGIPVKHELKWDKDICWSYLSVWNHNPDKQASTYTIFVESSYKLEDNDLSVQKVEVYGRDGNKLNYLKPAMEVEHETLSPESMGIGRIGDKPGETYLTMITVHLNETAAVESFRIKCFRQLDIKMRVDYNHYKPSYKLENETEEVMNAWLTYSYPEYNGKVSSFDFNLAATKKRENWQVQEIKILGSPMSDEVIS